MLITAIKFYHDRFENFYYFCRMNEKEKALFYKNLREKLDSEFEFPLIYMFKFIVPSDNQKIAKVSQLFDENAEISIRESKGKKFTSLSVKTVMISSLEIIKIYKEASKIEGLMSL